MISVWIVSPAHGRLPVTRLMLAQRQRLCRELAERGIEARMLITACDENLDLAREYGAEVVETPNKPLGRKFNVGLQAAGERGADWVVWVGSDDWLHQDVFDPLPLPRWPRRPNPILIGHRYAIVDLARGHLRRCTTPSRYGVIPWVVPRWMLEQARFAPVDPRLSRGMDGGLLRGLQRSGVRVRWHASDPHDLRLVDFKTAANITPYERLAGHATGPEEDPWSALAERYDRDLVDLARSTHEQLREEVA